jgi:NAD(P)H-dependent FMN reductase
MKFFMFAASTNSQSINKKLITLAAKLIRQAGHEAQLCEFGEFDLPLYNADLNQKIGLPENAVAFIHKMHSAQGTIIASPEYNFSIPGTLKNLIDWVSRSNPQAWKNQRILLMSASPALVGGNRGLWATRVPLEACGADVFPDMFSLANAYQAFTDEGELKDDALTARLKSTLAEFTQLVSVLQK